jgi:arylsulfatase A-like enzyme
MAYRPLLIGLCAALVAAGFAAVAWFAALRSTWRRWPAAVIAALVLACLVVLVTSGAALVNEYLPLHQFLALWSLLFAILAGREVSRLLRLRLAPLAASAALLFSVGAGAFLAHAHADAWLLWSETGASRYLTRRWSFLTPSPAVDRLRAAMIVKPDLESTAAAERRAVRAAAVAPDIVVFSIDGLRMDRVGAYGTTRRQLTPTIDRFAARGVRFTRAFSSSPKTQVFNSELLLGRFVDRTARAQQPAGFHAEAISNLLKRRDYHIFVKGWFDQSLGGRFDPAPFHIDTYAPKAISAAALEEPMQEGLARVAHHLEEARALGRPALIWIHLLATHPMDRPGALGGYVPHPEFDFGDAEVDRYESAVAGSDRWLAGLEELFATSERPTAWFILSDHGVNTGTRTRDLHEPLVRVPLVVVAPGARAAVDDHLVDASLDLAATIVDLAGIAPPADYDGVSLVPLLVGLPAPSMDARLVPLSLTGWSGAVHGRFKYLRQGDVESLFDLAADPGERHNLIGQEFERAFAMSSVATRELERRRQAAAEARRAR